ncbi:Toll/interleukin-1 receptor homology (TIR) domain-containing protein [Cynara cardunculus var. scolymus]|uniref:Toll/interleukin-1 receptor homology (TIR) domain-containing protein n=2 Tax=Cynara cardunculus var. scolymus TaxID=59895 RepID=A0A118K0Q8_CYNCS|nr:Toll/interleukin-1 receptor homology (TIR) domain-containing protein [Cynara cardunculus var. scolymus]
MDILHPSSSATCAYHIFLSFNCADIRKHFTDHLYTAFCNAGFHTFRDDHEIQKRQRIDSMMSVIVFSREYASSEWCLDELVRILQRRNSDDRHRLFPIFYNVEPTEVGYQKGSFKECFDRYEGSGEHSKEKIDEWREALKEVSKLTGKVLQDEYNG